MDKQDKKKKKKRLANDGSFSQGKEIWGARVEKCLVGDCFLGTHDGV